MDQRENTTPLNHIEWIIQWLLRLMGGIVVLAFVPIFFPRGLMAEINQTLGLGPAPEQPIFWFLARSLSLLYFTHGAIVLALSTDVRRFWPLIKLVGWLNLLMGLTLLGIDWCESMPWWWTLGEGPGIMFGAILLLVLIRINDRLTASQR
jgi:hypothetical protein